MRLSPHKLLCGAAVLATALPWFQSLLPEGCTVRDFLITCRI